MPDPTSEGFQPTTLAPAQVTWLKQFIRTIPDYPQPGILFRDITPLLQDAAALRFAIETLASRYRGARIDQVVGIESRGFIFGTPLAYLLNVGFRPVPNPGTLPYQPIPHDHSP